MDILFILIACAVYISIGISAEKDVKDKIKNYREQALWQQGYVDDKLAKKIVLEKKTICNLCLIGWPMYKLFLVGESLGTKVFEILSENSYENRIATWFV
jgi:hypothetical protein